MGRKTAACVLLFSFGMRDVPVDTHVSRVGTRLGLFRPGAPFEELHDDMLAFCPRGQELELHVNLLRHGRRTCHARGPRCGECALRRSCPWARGRGAAVDGPVRGAAADEAPITITYLALDDPAAIRPAAPPRVPARSSASTRPTAR